MQCAKCNKDTNRGVGYLQHRQSGEFLSLTTIADTDRGYLAFREARLLLDPVFAEVWFCDECDSEHLSHLAGGR